MPKRQVAGLDEEIIEVWSVWSDVLILKQIDHRGTSRQQEVLLYCHTLDCRWETLFSKISVYPKYTKSRSGIRFGTWLMLWIIRQLVYVQTKLLFISVWLSLKALTAVRVRCEGGWSIRDQSPPESSDWCVSGVLNSWQPAADLISGVHRKWIIYSCRTTHRHTHTQIRNLLTKNIKVKKNMQRDRNMKTQTLIWILRIQYSGSLCIWTEMSFWTNIKK